MADDFRIWTDGAVIGNPGGYGGWAFVAEMSGKPFYEHSGSEGDATNNSMELAAVIEALRWLQHMKGVAEIHCDAKYVVDGSNVWRFGWRDHGWQRQLRKGGFAAVKNVEAWKEVDRLLDKLGKRVSIHWVKGHNGSPMNERADQLAVGESRRLRSRLTTGCVRPRA